MSERYSRLYRDLGYQFTDAGLLEQALTHRSVGSRNNERLEFLGDAVLSFIISGELFRRFTKMDEGRLSRLRAALVKGETLAKLARTLELGEYLRLGSGEMKTGGHRRESILADALEAVIGAVYLDSGVEAVGELVLRLFAERLEAASPETNLKDPKTRLQEYLQSRRLPLPVYSVLSVEGEPHDQTFEISCRIEGLAKETRGVGSSRRRAEQAAAQQALEKIDNG